MSCQRKGSCPAFLYKDCSGIAWARVCFSRTDEATDAQERGSAEIPGMAIRLPQVAELLLKAEVLLKEFGIGSNGDKTKESAWDDSELIYNMRKKYE